MISKAKIKLIHSLEQKKGRKAAGLFVAEGPKVVGDIMATASPVMLVATNDWLTVKHSAIPAETEIIEVTEEELRKVSFLQHPQQVIGIFHIPTLSLLGKDEWQKTNDEWQKTNDHFNEADGVFLALDSVQDPGNLGTIIRIADWFGIEEIFCSPETADVWNPKVIQATMGSIARVHVHYTDLNKLLDNLPKDFPVYGTLLDGDDINEADIVNRGIIVMGNEGNGISSEIAARVTHRLLIPNYPKGRATADSLNVAIATAITCFAVRQHS